MKNAGALPRGLVELAVDGERTGHRWNREEYGVGGERARGAKDKSSQIQTTWFHAANLSRRHTLMALASACMIMMIEILLRDSQGTTVPCGRLTATAEATEEPIIKAMVGAETMTGANYQTAVALPH